MNLAVVISVSLTVWVILALAALQTKKEVSMWKNAKKAVVKVTGYWEKFGQKIGVEVLLNARIPDEKCTLFIKNKEKLESVQIGDELEVSYARVLSGSGKVGAEKSNVTQLRLFNDSTEKDAKKLFILLIAIAVIVPVVLYVIHILTYIPFDF